MAQSKRDDKSKPAMEIFSPAEKRFRIEKFQKLQDDFSRLLQLCILCVDGEFFPMTDLSGGCGDCERIQSLFGGEEGGYLLERVAPGAMEDMAVEEYPELGLRLAALNGKADGQLMAYWLVAGSLEQEEGAFLLALDLLREASITLWRAAFADGFLQMMEQNKDELREDREAKILLDTVFSSISMLRQNETIEALMENFLRILGGQLSITDAQLIRYRRLPVEEAESGQESLIEMMDIISEWCRPGRASAFEKTRKLPAYSFLNRREALYYPVETPVEAEELAEELADLGIDSLALLPVFGQDNGAIFLCLNRRGESRLWRKEERDFATAGVDILHSILKGRDREAYADHARRVLGQLMDNVGAAILVQNPRTGEDLYVNHSLTSLLEMEFSREDLALMLSEERLGMGSGGWEVLCEANGRWYEVVHAHIPWLDKSQAAAYALYDITEKKQYQHRIEEQADTDFLTGLLNRSRCEKDLARHVDEAKKAGGSGAILYLDLDDFKHINEGLGHHYGDMLLKSVSKALRRIEGLQGNCYRVGGDEFVLLLPMSHFHLLESVVEGVGKVFNRPWFLKDSDYYCTMSMGMVDFPGNGESVSDLMRKADISMYEAKNSGKNRVARYSDSLDSYSGRRLDIERSMRDACALGCGEFQIFFQPIIDTSKDVETCVGAEALVRWNNRRLGFISPGEFIPLAESLGLINPIGTYVLKEACRQCLRWNESGHGEFKVNVNLSVVQLTHPDILDIVEGVIKETGLAPKHLTLEVTESLAIHDMERMREILGRIKAMGVSIALDDFGTGYSSLNHIREIPLDVIKIDKSFINGLGTDAFSRSFVDMVSKLAKTIGVKVCVEGVETLEQCKVLADMEVQYIQGYYFGKPMPPEEFMEKFAPVGGFKRGMYMA